MAEKTRVYAGLKKILIWIEIRNRSWRRPNTNGQKFMIACSEIELVICLNGVYVTAATDVVVLSWRNGA
jgi:hypothetical protein